MTFEKFRSDISVAARKAASGGIRGVQSIARGDSDAEVVIVLHHASLPLAFLIRALAQNVEEYPDENLFAIFTDDENTPKEVLDAIETVQNYLVGLSVYEMVTEVSKQFENLLNRAWTRPVPVKPPNSKDEGKDEDEDATDDDFSDEFESDYESDGEIFGLASSSIPPHPRTAPTAPSQQQLQWQARIKQDLRQVIHSRFRVGILDGFNAQNYKGMVSISIRINKLFLSEEARSTWDVEDSDYVVLLIRFDSTNITLESILGQPAHMPGVVFRVGKCKRYKPSLQSALHAFSEPSSRWNQRLHGDQFMKLFISNSLDEYLNHDFVSLVKLRETHGCSWEEANENLISRRSVGIPGATAGGIDQGLGAFDRPADVNSTASDHPILADDHLTDSDCPGGRSFPLIAMQFAMRYFVKCTEFCLRCHRRLETDFEALRPYVCSNPLCLFQYMAMGLGPSIEHEILTEPYVVDLLVSLCYAAVSGPPGPPIPPTVLDPSKSKTPPEYRSPIRDLPVGLQLKVPNIFSAETTPLEMALAPPPESRLYFNGISLNHKDERVRPKKWFVYRARSDMVHRQAIILDVFEDSFTFEVVCKSDYSFITDPGWRDAPVVLSAAETTKATLPHGDMMLSKVDVSFYDTDFDSLDPVKQALSIRMMLDSLPSISKIEDYLNSNTNSSFHTMRHVSPAAASLLQWIVSSNRSCIFQVDRRPEQSQSPTQLASASTALAGRIRNRENERIPGMEGWIQFRFAQGSPDKEQRFRRALQDVARRNKTLAQNPTIFAWHGSMLYNWHSIIRSGLDYKDVRCGRAYGNGVYFSRQLATSISYSQPGIGMPWPNSDLKFRACISLNEIVNARDEFVSKSPHYVVSQLDWHQCRYLFVEPAGGARRRPVPEPRQNATNQTPPRDKAAKTAMSQETRRYHKQAAGLEILGADDRCLEIPLSAIPPRIVGTEANAGSAAPKRTIGTVDDDSASEDADDTKFLYSADELEDATGPPLKKMDSRASSSMNTAEVQSKYAFLLSPAAPKPEALTNRDRSAGDVTRFEPGTLDLSSLQRLDPPTFANSSATKVLTRELKNLQEIQSKTPLYELGWFIDFDQISNLFQWIVELHSFDLSLPLARDMSKAATNSIVLEFRFGAEFPMAPPFIRVVRPRFLPFGEGGGGHVTVGGAMCMQLLTNSGWSPANSMENVLLQIRLAICSTEPKPARLHYQGNASSGIAGGDYGIDEAVDAFLRAVRMHSWEVPHDLKRTANGV
ncbi:hypothetical protein B0T22DRAFT_520124 [Podospora appendiculata]|uniref:UBC core domain-containing protein n=1 Tax=Podospora appendiculata TaxID=314037 RepID=A0AAE0X302_9PEZI|nr:hypothetical protein B0T22DRAFT_520124 [Podospora appendiculata]